MVSQSFIICWQSGSHSSQSFMQGIALPGKVLNAIDKLNRDFIWDSIPVKRKMHIVSWDKITRPKRGVVWVYMLQNQETSPSLPNLDGDFIMKRIAYGPKFYIKNAKQTISLLVSVPTLSQAQREGMLSFPKALDGK